MKNRLRAEGFTVVETLIAIAVTGSMLMMAAYFINGKQAKTEFVQGVRTMQQQLQQVMSDVANGYYPNDNAISCSKVGTSPVITTATPQDQGTNEECIFVGRVIQFDVDGVDPEQYNIYTVAGLRTPVSGTGLNLGDVSPKVIPPTSGALFEDKTMPYGLKVDRVVSTDASGAATYIGSIGFAASLGSLDATDRNQQVNVLPIPGTDLGRAQATEIATINANLPAAGGIANPGKGIAICLSGGSGQYATLMLGGTGRQTSVSNTIGVTKSVVCT